MIARISGKLIEKFPGTIVIETGGIGFEVWISNKTFEKLPETGNVVTLNIYTHLREDEIRLVGFDSREEKELFLKLISVSGISIKIALSAYSIYSVDELKRIIVKKEVDLIRRIPGIGKKLAERMIVELRDKLEESEFAGTITAGIGEDDKIIEVKQALKTLGYNPREISRVIEKIAGIDLAEKKTEDILKIALKEM
jgi:holliday junction DNA helicase RuvA